MPAVEERDSGQTAVVTQTSLAVCGCGKDVIEARTTLPDCIDIRYKLLCSGVNVRRSEGLRGAGAGN